jgi:glycerate 2-kinase
MEPKILNFHQKVLKLVNQVIQDFSPENMIKSSFRRKKNTLLFDKTAWNLDYYRSITTVSIGKTAISSYKGISSIIPDNEAKHIVYTHKREHELEISNIFVGDHPHLSKRNIKNSKLIFEDLTKLGKDDLLFIFLDGSSSSLFEIPNESIEEIDLIDIYQRLMKKEISIYDTNIIRSLYSKIKNGRLLSYLQTRHVYVFIFSDVENNKFETVGSGPFFSFNHTTDTETLFKKKNLMELIKTDYKYVENKSPAHFLLTDNHSLLMSFSGLLSKEFQSYKAIYEKSYISLVINDFVDKIMTSMKTLPPKSILVLGGEIYLNVYGTGKAGRNQELIIRLLKNLEKEKNYSIYAIASDGKDGNSTASGAYINNKVKKLLMEEKIEFEPYLLQNNSFELFKSIGNLIQIESQTNLNDIFIIIKH